MCKFFGTLEPEWRRVSTSEVVRCENGDPFEQIVAQLNSAIIEWGQNAVNGLIRNVNNFLTSALCWLGVCPPGPFEEVCFGDPRRPRKCDGFPGDVAAANQHFAECENPAFKGGLDLTCYYHRVHTICSDDDSIKAYNKLFDKGYEDINELQGQLSEAFGQSFAAIDPTMLDLVNQAHISTLSGPDLQPRRDICSGEAFASSMRLDQIVSLLHSNTHPFQQPTHPLSDRLLSLSCSQIVSCIFAMVEKGKNCDAHTHYAPALLVP
jgi:hypothetical protein